VDVNRLTFTSGAARSRPAVVPFISDVIWPGQWSKLRRGQGFKVGDRVWATNQARMASRTFAEFAAVDHAVAPIPEGISDDDIVALSSSCDGSARPGAER